MYCRVEGRRPVCMTHMCMMYSIDTLCAQCDLCHCICPYFSPLQCASSILELIYTCSGLFWVIPMHHEQVFPNFNKDHLTMQRHLTRGPPAPVSFSLGIGLILQLGTVQSHFDRPQEIGYPSPSIATTHRKVQERMIIFQCL